MDETTTTAFRSASAWSRDDNRFGPQRGLSLRPKGPGSKLASFSGMERNRFFRNVGGKEFEDLSAVSGLDSVGDSRGFALLDLDRDGWQDIALVQSNAPLLRLLRNRIGDQSSPTARNNFVAMRFVGGNHSKTPDSRLSSRDAIGAVARLKLDNRILTRELRAGEGFAAQNSKTLLIGLGASHKVEGITVRWPSGRITSTKEPIMAGSLVTAMEASEEFNREPWRQRKAQLDIEFEQERFRVINLPVSPDEARYRLFTTMATWCPACKRELPRLRRIRNAIPPSLLAMYGIPIDPKDHDKLDVYEEQEQLPYILLRKLNVTQRRRVVSALRDEAHTESLPSYMLTLADGQIIEARPGVPTISHLLRRIRQHEAANAVWREGRSP